MVTPKSSCLCGLYVYLLFQKLKQKNLKYLLIYFFIFYLFLAELGLYCCVWAFCNCGKQVLLVVVVCRLLIVVASLVAEHGL